MVGHERILEWEEELSHALSDAVPGIHLCCFERCSSTMDRAREEVRSVPTAPVVLVLAREQSAGRGRQGRTWTATEGALVMTVAIRIAKSASELSGLSLVVGVVLAEWGARLGTPLAVKWPNDLMSADGRKLAGVLVEVVPTGSVVTVYIGIGMNLLAAPSDLPCATSLRELTGMAYAPPSVAAAILLPLVQAVREFEAASFGPFRDRWLQRGAHLGSMLTIDVGGEVVRGICRGVSPSGALLIDSGGEVREIVAGHVLGSEPGKG